MWRTDGIPSGAFSTDGSTSDDGSASRYGSANQDEGAYGGTRSQRHTLSD